MSSPLKQTKTQQSALNDLLYDKNEGSTKVVDTDDDFNPRANAYAPVSQGSNSNAEFGDFASAFGEPAKPKDNNDEFADFTSAFNSVDISSNKQQLPVASNVSNSLMDNLGAPPMPIVPQSMNTGTGNLIGKSATDNSLLSSAQPQFLNSSNNNTGSYIFLTYTNFV